MKSLPNKLNESLPPYSIEESRWSELENVAKANIAKYTSALANNKTADGWKVVPSNNGVIGWHILGTPIRIIMKDKWGDAYFGYLWGFDLPNTGISPRMDSVSCKVVARKVENDTSSKPSNFAYSIGSIKWSETKIVAPKKIDKPTFDKLAKK